MRKPKTRHPQSAEPVEYDAEGYAIAWVLVCPTPARRGTYNAHSAVQKAIFTELVRGTGSNTASAVPSLGRAVPAKAATSCVCGQWVCLDLAGAVGRCPEWQR